MLSEKVTLLGKGLYQTIPDEISITSIPTASELEYVGAEDFDRTMLEKIFPKVIENSDGMNFNELLDIDYDWICRCLRMKSYGPFFTTNRIFCPKCSDVHQGEWEVDLRNVGINVLPPKFVNNIVIDPDEAKFIEFDERIVLRLLTVKDELAIQQDNAFKRNDGVTNVSLARLCYSIKSIGSNDAVTPIDAKITIQQKFGDADYKILKETFRNYTNYGLQASGAVRCPVCGSLEAYFIAFQNDKFFRPTLGDLHEWREAIRSNDWQGLLGNPSDYVRDDS